MVWLRDSARLGCLWPMCVCTCVCLCGHVYAMRVRMRIHGYVCVCIYTLHATCLLSRFSHVRLFATPWTVARQAPLSMGFFRQEYWSGLPCPPPGDLPHPGIEPVSLSPALAGGFFPTCVQLIATSWTVDRQGWEAHSSRCENPLA